VIYDLPLVALPIDQGDILDHCPVLAIVSFDPSTGQPQKAEFESRRVIVVTQTCDLANDKTTAAQIAEVFDAQFLVDQGTFKPSDIKGPIRAGRVWGWYFLPADSKLELPEMIVDLRRLHTIQLDLLLSLVQAGQRRARVQPLYREHLAKHFADTFSRIGLPRPYETM
jgi:hypothetical protein